MTAGAILAPSACGGDDDATSPECPLSEASEAFFPQSVASGDPRPDSVILWTRLADAAVSGDLPISFQVALDEAFTQVIALTTESNRRSVADDAAGVSLASLTAEERYGHCVKVKITGLSPATTYYYRFYYKSGDTCYASRIGRTKTAPAPDADVPVRFGYISCQDYIGRYYNSHRIMAREDLDFFVVLGDYIYETTGDPSFQSPSDTRKVTFTDESGAISLEGADGSTFFAARTLGNYRELYRTYRGDPALQRLHELFPVLPIWDDHEYSDDCFGATATYFDGAKDEHDIPRRKAANQAWFEFMPVDYMAGDDYEYNSDAEYLQDITIYRDFRFGKNVHLVLTDLRSYRDDHLIPEEAFPGAVAATEEALDTNLGNIPTVAKPYVEIDSYQGGIYKERLIAAAPAVGYDPAVITGDISVAYINRIVEMLNESSGPGDQTDLIDPEAPGLKLGISYFDLGKFGLNSSIGSRYLVDKNAFDALSQTEWNASGGENERVMGSEQEEWFLKTVESSDSTWKVWANEYCLAQLAINLVGQPVPADFQREFYLMLDGWDGFPNRRSAILGRIGAKENVVAITGDIHAFYAGRPTAISDGSRQVIEIVGSSASSKTFKEELESQVKADPILSQIPEAAFLASLIDSFLTNPTTNPNPTLAYANSGEHGFCVAEASSDEFMVTMHQMPISVIHDDYADREDELAGLFKKMQFKTMAKTKELFQFDEATSAWLRWDQATRTWE
ncbi:alkaline phosphatase D family protein [Chondromyces crocatus]|uniref:alkaline phosphatase D family protein n=1 Tax=Chondromyces crocatus TaxID=52 RepID=UPI001FE221DF|nr:alkaline phosphatase D family protein [Chondromyces crocatus]